MNVRTTCVHASTFTNLYPKYLVLAGTRTESNNASVNGSVVRHVRGVADADGASASVAEFV